MTNTTPYAAAKFVNSKLAEAFGEDNFKPIPPQMMYNYTRGQVNKGKKPFIKYDFDTNHVDQEALEAWTTKYVEKRVEKANAALETAEQDA